MISSDEHRDRNLSVEGREIALFLGWPVLGEQLSWNAAVGLVLILLGLAVTHKRLARLTSRFA